MAEIQSEIAQDLETPLSGDLTTAAERGALGCAADSILERQDFGYAVYAGGVGQADLEGNKLLVTLWMS